MNETDPPLCSWGSGSTGGLWAIRARDAVTGWERCCLDGVLSQGFPAGGLGAAREEPCTRALQPEGRSVPRSWGRSLR